MQTLFIDVVTRRIRAELVSVAAATLVFSGAATAQSTVRYQVSEVHPSFPDSTCDCSTATGISPAGIVTGLYQDSQRAARAFVWQSGIARDIGGMPGVPLASVAVNDQGAVAGFGSQLGFRAENGRVTNLPSLGGTNSAARDINNAGVVVGEASSNDSTIHAAMWVGTAVTDLGTLGGWFGRALGINEMGQIVGTTVNDQGEKVAFKWTPTLGMRMLPRPVPDAALMEAVAINNRDEAVGTATVLPTGSDEISQQFRGYVWGAGGGAADLGDLTPPLSSTVVAITPTAINDVGQVVGIVTGQQDDSTAFVWHNGVMRDLNSLVDPTLGYRIFSATDINNSGQIAATGIRNGRARALLLSPLVPVCRADYNFSGSVNLLDLFEFLGAYFTQSAAADFDHSGEISVQDVFEFLAAYFEPCP